MLTIDNIINNNLYTTPAYNSFFYPVFKVFFPNGNIRNPANPIEPSEMTAIESSEGGDPYRGGAYPNYNPYNRDPYNRDPYNRDPYNRNPYNRPTYYNPQYMAHNMEKKTMDKDDSQLAYLVTIDMELRPGTSLSPGELTNAKCNSKWNSIRKSYADLVGKPYVIPPIYNKTIKNKEETSSNKTQNLRPEPQNNTRKNIKGGKHNRTVKNK
jgi:hypothetical protein